MFERIDRLITNHDFAFQAWYDRYGKGVWAALGLWENMVDTVRDLSSASDLDMIAATEYVFSVSWLPVVTGRTLNEAMAALEEKLASLPQDQLNRGSEWAAAVQRAIEDLRYSWEAADAYGDLDGKLPTLPAKYSDLVAAR